MIKLIVSDIDGTLVNNQKEIPHLFWEVFEQVHQKGILFCVASGRQIQSLYELFAPIKHLIAFAPDNGASLIYQGRTLFERTMRREIDGMKTPDYLWDRLGIVPFLKVDKGLQELQDGVQLMKPFPALNDLLIEATQYHVFGTKMRSVIKEANEKGIKAIVDQQFEWGKEILAHDLMPILEPEVDIHCPDKVGAERILKRELLAHLDQMDRPVMLKITLPTEDNFYKEVIEHPNMLRVVALSGGYSREHANELLARNKGIIASFSRALAEGLTAQQTDAEFNTTIDKSVDDVYQASIR